MIYLLAAIIGISLILLVLTPTYAYLKKTKRHNFLMILVKGLTTLISVLFAAYGTYMLSKNGANAAIPAKMLDNYWLVAGLILCMLGDIFLCIFYVIGGVFFFFGHICYIVYFLSISSFNPLMIPILTLLCTLTLCYFYKYSERLGILKPLFAIYGVAIFTTLSIAVFLPFSCGIYGCCPALAALMLIISDIMLARNKMVIETPVTLNLSLHYYFGGQFLLAMTVFLPLTAL